MSEQSERLFDGITQVDDDLVDSARVTRRRPWRGWVAAAACLALIVGLVAMIPPTGMRTSQAEGASPYALAEAVYPTMAFYPDEENYVNSSGQFDDEAWLEDFQAWRADIMRQADQPEGYADGLGSFFRRSTQTFLSDSGDENVSYSPVNVYMALAMLAEATGGSSREQILNLLGSSSMEDTRAQAGSVWNANYRSDGMTTSVPASSLWLRDDADYDQHTVNLLANSYYASVFRGEMGSEDYDLALQDWLNRHTAGLLSDQASQEHMKADNAMTLAATLYFRTKWAQPFDESATQPGAFHAPAGDETADFMHRRSTMTYYYGKGFGAVALALESGGAMWLLLPDEGLTPKDLLTQGEAMDFLAQAQQGWKKQKDVVVNLSLPKFDTSCRYSLLDGLRALGITDICDPAKADFSPMQKGKTGVFLSDANHAVRVAIDEEGVVAAAYTVMSLAESSAPPADEIDFTLDRPFLYTITGDQGVPLFTGLVNTVG